MPDAAVYGILWNRSHLKGLVNSLRREGFRGTDISLLLAPGSETVGNENQAAAVSTSQAFRWPVGVTALAFPGVGPLIGAGPIMDSFAMEGLVGSLVRALSGIGIAESYARRFERRIKSGGLLLAVRCCNRLGARRARRLLEQRGAEEIWSTD